MDTVGAVRAALYGIEEEILLAKAVRSPDALADSIPAYSRLLEGSAVIGPAWFDLTGAAKMMLWDLDLLQKACEKDPRGLRADVALANLWARVVRSKAALTSSSIVPFPQVAQ